MPTDIKTTKDIQDLIVTVMGLGRYSQGSGVGAAKWLLRHGAQIVITDLKSEKDLKASVKLVTDWYEKYRAEFPDREIYAPVFILGQHREDDFVNVELVVKNPDVPKGSAYIELANKNNVQVESDVSLFMHFYDGPVYAVTGTRGKSTTTSLFGKMLQTKDENTVVAGNIMHSPLEDLDQLMETPAPVALELSSWLLESLVHFKGKKAPQIAVLTNISKDHLDRYGSYEEYIESKSILFNLQNEDQYSVANFDDDIVRQIGDKAKSKTYWFSTKPLPEGRKGAYLDSEGNLIARMNGEERKICHVSNWPALQGEHNQANALAATVAAMLAEVTDEGICKALKEYEGLEGRQQTVREYEGVAYINDTTATTATGTIAALNRFGNDSKNIVLIVGGKSKGDEYNDLAEVIKKTCKHVVYLEGQHTTVIEEKVGSDMPHDHVNKMKDAVEAAQNAAKEGDVVLLSPAGSSFDLFQNEFDRGGQFVEAVKNLK